MARPRKQGLDYFPLDVDIFEDIKIRKLIRYQGGKAFTVYALLLCIIYKDGCCARWDKELPFVVSEKTGLDEVYILEVIKSCLALGLFDRRMFDERGLLTSDGIQRRYRAVAARNGRSACFLPENMGFPPGNYGLPPENACFPHEKYTKENKRKEKETDYVGKEKPPPSPPEEKNVFFETSGLSSPENQKKGQKGAECRVLNAETVKLQGEAEETRENAENSVFGKNRLIPFDENAAECLSSRQWQEMVLMNVGLRQLDWNAAFSSFRANLVANGADTDKTRADFRKHFTNWLRIKTKSKENGNETKEMGGHDRPGGRAGLGRPEIAAAAKVPTERGKSVL